MSMTPLSVVPRPPIRLATFPSIFRSETTRLVKRVLLRARVICLGHMTKTAAMPIIYIIL